MEIKTPEKESEHKPVVDESGKVVLKKRSKISKGKKAKAAGGQFEVRVRKDLEKKGFVVDKWSNNIDLETNKIISAKRKFNPFSKVMAIGTGFPDFVGFQKRDDGNYRVIGIEVKTNGTLSKVEKEKCRVYLEKKTFSELWIASKQKIKNRVSVVYTDVDEILSRMR
jgi:hypothetical protein